MSIFNRTKLFFILSALAAVFALASCSSETSNAAAEEEVRYWSAYECEEHLDSRGESYTNRLEKWDLEIDSNDCENFAGNRFVTQSRCYSQADDYIDDMIYDGVVRRARGDSEFSRNLSELEDEFVGVIRDIFRDICRAGLRY